MQMQPILLRLYHRAPNSVTGCQNPQNCPIQGHCLHSLKKISISSNYIRGLGISCSAKWSVFRMRMAVWVLLDYLLVEPNSCTSSPLPQCKHPRYQVSSPPTILPCSCILLRHIRFRLHCAARPLEELLWYMIAASQNPQNIICGGSPLRYLLNHHLHYIH